MSIRIERLTGDPSDTDLRDLARLVLDAVDSGAGVSFMPGLTEVDAVNWWRTVVGTAGSRAAIMVARDDEGIVGTVQLQPAWAPNQPHRADVAKLIVHRRGRHRGIAKQLMTALENEAAAAGFTLLVLDTCEGSAAERLYTSMGWTRAGVIPGFALNPDGTLCDTVFFYKNVSGAPVSR